MSWRNMNGKVTCQILETNKDKNSPLIQRQYVFASDDDAKRLGMWINNSRLREKLKKDSVLAKIYRDYKSKYLKSVQFDDGLFSIKSYELEFYDLFVHANIACNAAKSFVRVKSKNQFTDREDLKILRDFILESNISFRTLLVEFKNKDILNCFHPYIKNVLSKNELKHLEIIDKNDNYLFNLISSDNYKKEEALFIRSSNDQASKIKNFITNQFIKSKKIFVCRFDVIFNFSAEFEKISVDEYRKFVTHFLESLPCFNSALEVIFPSVLLPGSIKPSCVPRGQILLIANKKLGSNLKKLKEFSKKEMVVGVLNFIPAQPIILEGNKKISIDGVLSFTPSVVNDISLLTDFLTIERRFCAPRQGNSDKNSSLHCLREVALNVNS